jgi:FlaA1/EpsC-like NDP-sugar epimerase
MSIPGVQALERHEAEVRVMLAFAITGGCIGFVLALYLAYLFPGIPRSALLGEWIGAILFAAFIGRVIRKSSPPLATPRGRRALVVGSGERAEQLLREPRWAEMDALNVVGLVDLNGAGMGRTIEGVRVVGTIDDLPKVARQLRVELAIIALEAGDLPQMRHVVDQCIAGALQFKTLPSLHELPQQASGVNQLRNVLIEDLLGRAPVNLDLPPVKADLRDRVVLLTGAAGSIGSELARQIASFGPARLVLLDQSESDLYFAHLELQEAHPGLALQPVICDITHAGRLAQVFAQHRPDYVVHAAAYKHVPLMETNVLEAVRNNVLGTLLVATTAVRYGASKVLLVSTDKAIKPSSVMGATKRVAERIIFGLPNLHRSGTDFRGTVRKRARLQGECHPSVRAAAGGGRADHGHASVGGTVLHDHPGSCPASAPSGITSGDGWRHRDAGNGRAGPHSGSGREADLVLRKGSGQGHSYCVHRIETR